MKSKGLDASNSYVSEDICEGLIDIYDTTARQLYNVSLGWVPAVPELGQAFYNAVKRRDQYFVWNMWKVKCHRK